MSLIKKWKPITAVLLFPYILLCNTQLNIELVQMIGFIAALEYAEIWFDTRPSANSQK